MNIFLEQLTMHRGAMQHLATLTKVAAPTLTVGDLIKAEQIADQLCWLHEDILEAIATAVERSTIPAPVGEPGTIYDHAEEAVA